MTDLLATQWVDTDHKCMVVFSPLEEKVFLIPMLCSYLEEGRGCKQIRSIHDIPASSLSSYAFLYELLWEHDFPNPWAYNGLIFPLERGAQDSLLNWFGGTRIPSPYCLENPRDGAAWWAAVYGVAQSRTRLKQLSSSSSSGIWSPDPGLNLGTLHWEGGVLATGPSGKSLDLSFIDLVSSHLAKLYYV